MKWNFPGNNDGQIRGYSDAGIETFKSDHLKSLAREVCQNSLDAAKIENEEVTVEFKKEMINSEDIPGYDDYKQALIKCESFSTDEKSKKFLKEAIQELKENKQFVLRISDYNTTGLSKPFDDKDTSGGWIAITKGDGISNKSGDKGGSYGIGKNAPFCSSYYRLLFYRTFNKDGERATQGIAKLMTFENENGEKTTGIGYYGNDRNMPTEKISLLDKINTREKEGTDIFIYGFISKQEDWKDILCIEILENFMMSILNKKLSVEVEGFKINSDNIGEYIEKHKEKSKDAYSFYQSIVSRDKKEYEQEFHRMGTLKLSLLLDNNKKLNKKIMITRSAGMKLFNKGSINKNNSFTGVLEMKGERLNKYFRQMEPPSHDDWKATLHEDSKTARKYKKEVEDWIKEKVIESIGQGYEEEKIVTGLGTILQINSAKDDKLEKDKVKRDPVEVSSIIEESQNEKGVIVRIDDGVKGKLKSNKVKGRIDKNGEEIAIRKLKGTRKRKKRENYKGIVDNLGEDIIDQKTGREEKHDLENLRIIKISNNTFRVSFLNNNSVSSGYVKIFAVGENGSRSEIKIKSVKSIDNFGNMYISEDRINFLDMNGKGKNIFDFSLIVSKNYTMEVYVYENK